MKPVFVVAVFASALIASRIFLGDGPGVASAPSPQTSGAIETVQLAAATDRIVTLKVDNMFCAACPYIVRQSLASVPGVKDVSVSFSNKTAIVTFDSARTNVAALTAATYSRGYPSELVGR